MSIVKAIADAHHGSAWVTTEEGKGATFGLELPAGPAPVSLDDDPGAPGATAATETWAVDPETWGPAPEHASGARAVAKHGEPDPPTNPFPPVQAGYPAQPGQPVQPTQHDQPANPKEQS